jgi:hypothetical protein
VKHDLDRLALRRLADRPQDALGIVDVDVPDEREAQQGHGFLPVDQRDHRSTAGTGEAVESALAHSREARSLEDRL